jgi:predicted lactoylglutathione lyase
MKVGMENTTKSKMDARLNVITLGVADVEKAKRFYERLGWKASSASQDDVVFFQVGGVVLALYPRKLLAEDATVPSSGSGFRGFTLAQNVDSKEKVSEILKIAENAGGKVLKPAQDVFWGGHSGYFSDLDGNLWEVAWNPHFRLNTDGILQLP